MSEQRQPEWVLTPTTRKLEFDSVKFVAPNGFMFTLYKTELIPLLARLGLPSYLELVFSDSTRIRKEGDDILIIDSDPWENQGFNSGDILCDIEGLILVIANYVRAQWPKR